MSEDLEVIEEVSQRPTQRRRRKPPEVRVSLEDREKILAHVMRLGGIDHVYRFAVTGSGSYKVTAVGNSLTLEADVRENHPRYFRATIEESGEVKFAGFEAMVNRVRTAIDSLTTKARFEKSAS